MLTIKQAQVYILLTVFIFANSINSVQSEQFKKSRLGKNVIDAGMKEQICRPIRGASISSN